MKVIVILTVTVCMLLTFSIASEARRLTGLVIYGAWLGQLYRDL